MQQELEECRENTPDGYDFKNKGNEKQFHLNVGIIADITRALTSLEEGRSDDANYHLKRAIVEILKGGRGYLIFCNYAMEALIWL